MLAFRVVLDEHDGLSLPVPIMHPSRTADSKPPDSTKSSQRFILQAVVCARLRLGQRQSLGDCSQQFPASLAGTEDAPHEPPLHNSLLFLRHACLEGKKVHGHGDQAVKSSDIGVMRRPQMIDKMQHPLARIPYQRRSQLFRVASAAKRQRPRGTLPRPATEIYPRGVYNKRVHHSQERAVKILSQRLEVALRRNGRWDQVTMKLIVDLILPQQTVQDGYNLQLPVAVQPPWRQLRVGPEQRLQFVSPANLRVLASLDNIQMI